MLSLMRPLLFVLVGTLWPDRYNDFVALPDGSGDDRYAREREVLDLTDTVRVGGEFSAAEQARAREAGKHDRRIADALTVDGVRLPQMLAAGRELVDHWHYAESYGRAVLTASLDAARLGVRAPLAADTLRAAAPGYCTSRERALAPGDWFDRALAYATATLRGATAALDPVSAGMGEVSGYVPADYLVQQAARERGGNRIPASTWDALAAAGLDHDDVYRLARSAHRLQLLSCAIPLYGRLHRAGDAAAGDSLFGLLADSGDADGMRDLAEAGHERAQLWIAAIISDADPSGAIGRMAAIGDADGLRHSPSRATSMPPNGWHS